MREKLEEYGDIQLQAYAFLSLTTMARVNAVANLKWKQVNLEERICTDVIEKEGKIVELSFSVETKNYLENLLQYRKDNNIDDHGWLFITPYVTEDKPIRNSTLNDWCKKIGAMIDVPTLTCPRFQAQLRDTTQERRRKFGGYFHYVESCRNGCN